MRLIQSPNATNGSPMNAPLRSHRYVGMPPMLSTPPNREHSPPDDVHAQQYRRDAAAALIQPLTYRVSEQPIAHNSAAMNHRCPPMAVKSFSSSS